MKTISKTHYQLIGPMLTRLIQKNDENGNHEMVTALLAAQAVLAAHVEEE